MRLPRLRVRTYMLLVGVVALLVWGTMIGVRWYTYYRFARIYSFQERSWRENAQRDLSQGNTRTVEVRWGLQTADYYAGLVRKYRARCGARGSPSSSNPPFFTPAISRHPVTHPSRLPGIRSVRRIAHRNVRDPFLDVNGCLQPVVPGPGKPPSITRRSRPAATWKRESLALRSDDTEAIGSGNRLSFDGDSHAHSHGSASLLPRCVGRSDRRRIGQQLEGHAGFKSGCPVQMVGGRSAPQDWLGEFVRPNSPHVVETSVSTVVVWSMLARYYPPGP